MRKIVTASAIILTLASTASFAQTLFGVGLTASTLGPGVQGAVSLWPNANIRGGFNIFQYNDSFSKDGIDYTGNVKLRSAQLTYDQFFGQRFAAFHISPGVLFYNGNGLNANAAVPAGGNFTLGGVAYTSSTPAPVSGTGKVTFNKAAPMLLIGFGNMLPRDGHHFGFTAEAGFVYQGAPSTTLNLTGSACYSPSTSCAYTTEVIYQQILNQNIVLEQQKINNDLRWLRFYPVVSAGFGYRF